MHYTWVRELIRCRLDASGNEGAHLLCRSRQGARRTSDDPNAADWLSAHPKEAAAFMKAVKRGSDYMFAAPVAAWSKYCEFKV